jgi:tetratricopeptide (TPR) repeat protein
MYESRYGRWITAFRYGWQGVTALKEAYGLTPSLKDALMGVATYDYWRSAMTKMLWWMPGVEDKRVEAIRVLYAVVDSSVYVQEAAGKHLGFALNNEKRYGEGLTVANKLLARYPGYLVFQWMAIDAYMGLKKYEEAERLLKLVLQRVEMQRVENHYNEIQCHYKLALIYLEQNRYSLCLYECSRISELPTDDATRKRLEDQFSSVEQIRKNAMSGSRSEKQKFMK